MKLIMREHEWSEIAKQNEVDRLPLTGEKYHQSVYLSTQSPFWKSVVASYKKWYICFKTKHPVEAGKEFL